MQRNQLNGVETVGSRKLCFSLFFFSRKLQTLYKERTVLENNYATQKSPGQIAWVRDFGPYIL
jgi:hypothetical protein